MLQAAFSCPLLGVVTMNQLFFLGVGLSALLIGGCSAPTKPANEQDIRFPEPERSYLSEGDFIDPVAVRRIRAGMTRDQVRLNLGHPHFSEGIFRVPEWNYLFRFRQGLEEEVVTCQYKVVFNKGEVSSYHWSTPECALLVESPVVEDINDERRDANLALNLSTDALFRFGGASMSDVYAEGLRSIDQLAKSLVEDFGHVEKVTVIGHTDRLGSAESNLALSLARAETVKALLVERGVPSSLIVVEGKGDTLPLTQCEGTEATPVLVSCLQPNRRVEIVVVAR